MTEEIKFDKGVVVHGSIAESELSRTVRKGLEIIGNTKEPLIEAQTLQTCMRNVCGGKIDGKYYNKTISQFNFLCKDYVRNRAVELKDLVRLVYFVHLAKEVDIVLLITTEWKLKDIMKELRGGSNV